MSHHKVLLALALKVSLATSETATLEIGGCELRSAVGSGKFLSGCDLGVGSDSPTAPLHVNNLGETGSGAVTALRLEHPGINVGDGPKLLFTAGESTAGASIQSFGTSYDKAELHFAAGGDTVRMAIQSTGNMVLPGNLGIGVGLDEETNVPLYVGKTDSQFFNRIQVKNGEALMSYGQWDGVNNRIETAGKPFLLAAYNGHATISAYHNSGGTSVKVGQEGFEISSGKKFFLGGHSDGCMGMAYSPNYPNYGIFYKEGSPDSIHLSPNNEGCGSGSALVVKGDGKVVASGAVLHGSDLKLKNVNGALPYGLKEIENLKPVLFSYSEGNVRGLNSKYEHAGFVAQEVLAAGITHAVEKSEEDGLLNLNTQPILATLVNAVKELKAALDLQAAEIAELKRVNK